MASSSNALASIIGGLESAGVVSYQLATGQPVSATIATPQGVISTGTSAVANSLLPIVLVIAIAFVAYALLA